MLNFFVQLINTIGLPVVLVGTYKAISVLSGEFRQTRRGTGQGDLVWDRMKKDETWDWFLECLWGYQYVQNLSHLTPALNQALYDVTQGITDFAVKVYMLTQIRAITTGEEAITEQGIRLAAQESLRMANPILSALRTGDIRILHSVEDVHPIDLDSFLQEAQSKLNKPEQLRVLAQTRNKPSDDTTNILQETQKKTRRRKKNILAEGSLPVIADEGEKHKLSAYESLRQAGLIRSATEYLLEEVSS
jgi:hypothetical protein